MASSTTSPIASTRPNRESVSNRKPEHRENRERTDQRHGHGEHWDQRCAPSLQEDVDDQHHQPKRLQQCLHDLANARRYSPGGIERHFIVQILRKALPQPRQLRAHGLRRIHRVRARQLVQRQNRRRSAVKAARQVIGLGPQLNSRDVFQS